MIEAGIARFREFQIDEPWEDVLPAVFYAMLFRSKLYDSAPQKLGL